MASFKSFGLTAYSITSINDYPSNYYLTITFCWARRKNLAVTRAPSSKVYFPLSGGALGAVTHVLLRHHKAPVVGGGGTTEE